MAPTIHYSSRLAELPIPASSVPPSSDFTVLSDSRGRPVIFAIGTDSTFRALIEDDELNRQSIDVSNLLKLHEGIEKVVRFAVVQNSTDHAIFLTVGTEISGMQTPGRLFVLRPFKPEAILSWSQEILQSILISGSTALAQVPNKLLLVSYQVAVMMPLVRESID